MNIKSVSVLALILTTTGCGSGGSDSDSGSDSGSGSGSDTVNASVCFNETLVTVGTEYTLKTKKDNDEVITHNYKVLDEKPFKGQPAIRIQDTLTEESMTETSYNYVFVDSNEKSISFLGNTTDTILGSIETSLTPGHLTKFNLNSGSAYEQTTTMRVESPSLDVDYINDSKITFKGFETITVPAGTYKTCKFEFNSSITMPDGSTDKINTISWIAVEHGFGVQSVEGKSTTRLVEVTINGTKV
ncbi:hypothetical protein AKG98_852 [Moritella sp. JT01]|uniref:hypothetical protein n=1 Tax=Moritella sp. JT01 TaxID=756698 RepID=UPI000793E9FB|nr:hypothetical protein [Moritella sp. JT01]KXO10071.1 hypothetical protein AKG98_852 [Moritella sp. JT01]